MISELIGIKCRVCGSQALIRIGRREDDFDLVDGALCEVDRWEVLCPNCGESFWLAWQAWPVW